MTSPSRRTRLVPIAAAAIAALLAIPMTYALIRGGEALLTEETNPALVVWSTRIAMFWRVALGCYVGTMIAPVAYLAARRRPMATLRALQIAVVVVGLLAAAQGMLLP